MHNFRTTLSVLVLALSPAMAAADDAAIRTIEKIMYGVLAAIKYFGFIYARVEGTDVEKKTQNPIGLDDDEMTQFLRLRFKNNFAQVPFKDESAFLLKSDEEKARQGYLWCQVWTVGDSFPVAHYVRCMMGTGKNARVLEDASLGYANKENAIQAIRSTLDRIVTGFAQTFFRVRGDI